MCVCAVYFCDLKGEFRILFSVHQLACESAAYLGSYAPFLGCFGLFFGHIFLLFVILCSDFVHLFRLIVN